MYFITTQWEQKILAKNISVEQILKNVSNGVDQTRHNVYVDRDLIS